ncbi:MAG: hypothetical protein FWE88_08170 [Phycisphaerae bacterium]|nr:hypothetical protein [Phycisphaerae bacterium]
MKNNAAILLLLAVVVGGCVTGTGTRGCPEFVAPLETIVAEYNANADAVSWLSAQARITMTVQDTSGWSFTWGGPLGSSNGKVLFEKNPQSPQGPHYFVLVGRESGRELFRLGVNPDEELYYLWFQMGDRGGAWAGQNALAGSPGQVAMPIDPLGMVSLLNVTPLPWGADLPLAAMTVEGPIVRNGKRQPPSYVLTYVDRQPLTGRPLSRREVYFAWTDPAKQDFRQPYKIMFLGPEGRRIMTAYLSNYQEIADSKTADGRPAVMPTLIELEHMPWPGVPTVLKSMRISLSAFHSVRGDEDGDPKEASRFWQNLPTGLQGNIHMMDSAAVPPGQKGTP